MASRDGSIHIRDLRTGKLKRRLRARLRNYNVPLKFYANALAFDGVRIWIGSSDGTLRAYNVDQHRFVFENKGKHGAIRCITIADGNVWEVMASLHHVHFN